MIKKLCIVRNEFPTISANKSLIKETGDMFIQVEEKINEIILFINTVCEIGKDGKCPLCGMTKSCHYEEMGFVDCPICKKEEKSTNI